jgi:hypothetical protein
VCASGQNRGQGIWGEGGRELWTHALRPGEVEFAGARLLLCVRQTHLKKDGPQSISWRYFVTSLSTVDLSVAHLLQLVRLH